ncbi:hypothetical protein QM467_16360 [Rhodoblastus sp. 17X3]|uniref:cytochrome C oxidase subunit IV family protein n=1 Tax=Rhodoblastus sp. 17X3 TaxID=3047026 RepID=UPI0024B86707|nr:cytochrome C oxidase subunit IV family protein [Rhodoblastus sp. 17X3]MDI9849629.1 hypothetical protein [Rhodoblastus sp. 17X3]
MKASTRSLVFAWGQLMALTASMAFAANALTQSRPGAVWLVVIAGVAAAKARVVLGFYLGLSRAPAALAGFFAAAVAVLALVAASFLIFPTPAHSAWPQAVAQTFAGGNE